MVAATTGRRRVAAGADPGAGAGGGGDDAPERTAAGEGAVAAAMRADRGPDRIVGEGGGEHAGDLIELERVPAGDLGAGPATALRRSAPPSAAVRRPAQPAAPA